MGRKEDARRERDLLLRGKREQLARLEEERAQLMREYEKLEKRAQKSADRLKSPATYIRPKKALGEGAKIVEIGVKLAGSYDEKLIRLDDRVRDLKAEIRNLERAPM